MDRNRGRCRKRYSAVVGRIKVFLLQPSEGFTSALARSVAKDLRVSWFPFFSPFLWREPCLCTPSSTQTARDGCNTTPVAWVQKGKHCSRIQYFEFKICPQCSDTVRGNNSRELLPRIHAVSTTLHRCIRGFTVPVTVREGLFFRCTMPKNYLNM